MAYFPEYLGFDMNFGIDDSIDKLVSSSKSDETTRKNSLWKKKLTNFVKESALITQNIEEASKENINRLLCAFVISSKKENCDNYEVNSLRSMYNFLGTYIKEIKKGDCTIFLVHISKKSRKAIVQFSWYIYQRNQERRCRRRPRVPGLSRRKKGKDQGGEM